MIAVDEPVEARRRLFEQRTAPLLPTLYRIARRLSREPADAEDIVHDAYLKAFRAAASVNLDDTDGCRAWLTRIVINTARDRQRRDRRWSWLTPISVDDAGDDSTSADLSAANPETEAQQAEFRARAHAAILALPPEVGEVVVLALIEGFSQRETGEILDIPEGTVASRLARGRRLLRDRLAAFASDPPKSDPPKSDVPKPDLPASDLTRSASQSTGASSGRGSDGDGGSRSHLKEVKT